MVHVNLNKFLFKFRHVQLASTLKMLIHFVPSITFTKLTINELILRRVSNLHCTYAFPEQSDYFETQIVCDRKGQLKAHRENIGQTVKYNQGTVHSYEYNSVRLTLYVCIAHFFLSIANPNSARYIFLINAEILHMS